MLLTRTRTFMTNKVCASFTSYNCFMSYSTVLISHYNQNGDGQFFGQDQLKYSHLLYCSTVRVFIR
jgi:hypothetical protein